MDSERSIGLCSRNIRLFNPQSIIFNVFLKQISAFMDNDIRRLDRKVSDIIELKQAQGEWEKTLFQ